MRDISMHILDIIGNSVRAKANLIEVAIIEDIEKDILVLKVKDDGCGMDNNTLQAAQDPFFTSRKTRKVGLGIPLLKQNAELSEGEFKIDSEVGVGTEVEATFVHSHIDRPPLGDIASTVSLMVSGNPEVDFIYKHTLNKKEYVLRTYEVKSILDGLDITQPSVVKFIKQMIEENLLEIGVEI